MLGAPCCLALSLSIPPYPWGRCATLITPIPGCPTILMPLLTIMCTAYTAIRSILTPCLFWRCFRQYTLTMIVAKVSDQQKMIARESWTDEKTGVPERSRVLHHPCQKDFALNSLCPGYHWLTCNNPGGEHWNLLPKGIQAYAAWIVCSSPDSRLGWDGEKEHSPKTLMNLCLWVAKNEESSMPSSQWQGWGVLYPSFSTWDFICS